MYEARGVHDGESKHDVHDAHKEELQPAEAEVDVAADAYNLVSLLLSNIFPIEVADLIDAGQEDVGDDLRDLE